MKPPDVGRRLREGRRPFVRDVAYTFSWLRYHTWLSRHSPAGFPDEVLVRGDRLVFAELKSEKGKLSDEQERWLEALRGVPGVEVYVWRPADVDAIATALR
jgi:VRR-NUC domain-containing protein